MQLGNGAANALKQLRGIKQMSFQSVTVLSVDCVIRPVNRLLLPFHFCSFMPLLTTLLQIFFTKCYSIVVTALCVWLVVVPKCDPFTLIWYDVFMCSCIIGRIETFMNYR